MLIIVGMVVLAVGYAAKRSRSFREFQHDLRDGNEATGVFLTADVEALDQETQVTIIEPKKKIEYFPAITRLPAPVVYTVAAPVDEAAQTERMASAEQRLRAEFEAARRRQQEEWDDLVERHRCEWRTLISEFDNHMEWGNLVKHGGVLEDARYG
jgi:hypothetical protein